MNFCIIDTKYKLLLRFIMYWSINKDWSVFLNFLEKVTRVVYKHTLGIIQGLKLDKFKNIESRKIVGIFIKEECNWSFEYKANEQSFVKYKKYYLWQCTTI